MSTEMRVSSRLDDLEPRVLASRCSSWIRKSRRLPMSPPFFNRRSISTRWESRRVSSSATSMRMAKAVASVRARSRAMSLVMALPVAVADALRASFQRSMKRWRCCSTSWGIRGWASLARVRSCCRWSSSIVLRRWPSRSRALSSLSRPVLARAINGSCQSPGRLCGRLESCSTSATVRGEAWGSQARTLSCSPTSFWMSATLGARAPWSALPSTQARTSTLPRLRRPTSRSRKAGSVPRRSSGSLNVRSRKRLLTARISRPRPVLASLPSAPAGPSLWAVA